MATEPIDWLPASNSGNQAGQCARKILRACTNVSSLGYYRNASIKRPSAYKTFKPQGGRSFEGELMWGALVLF